jgi:hypothetical protein
MELILDSKFKVTTDSSLQNYILWKLEDITNKKTKETKQDYITIGYFGHNLGSLLKRYKDEVLIDLKNTTLEEILDKLNQIDGRTDKVVKAAKIKMMSKDND